MPHSVHVEVILKEYSNNIKAKMITVIKTYLTKRLVYPNSIITSFTKDESIQSFPTEVKAVIVGDIAEYDKSYIDFSNLEINWHIYSLNEYEPTIQHDEDGETIISTQLILPSSSLFNLWENLYYDHNIKQNLLKYAQTMMEFSDKGVDCNVISCNRVILLHGPPGTGKTSLCKALAHKLSIHMIERFSSGVLIEINSHSLFSKWFSESGKLVNKLFSKIIDILENKDLLVCLLIDEVESLARARDQCMSGTEPSDSIRVVNAVLTQIDLIKTYPNILIFATSNMTETIDLAFVDRADIKQFLGLPSMQAIYKIYHSCIVELMKAQIIKEEKIDTVQNVADGTKNSSENTKVFLKVCESSLGLSGRSLRKIPFVAHALFLEKPLVSLNEFLVAMEKAVEKEHKERLYFKHLKQEV